MALTLPTVTSMVTQFSVSAGCGPLRVIPSKRKGRTSSWARLGRLDKILRLRAKRKIRHLAPKLWLGNEPGEQERHEEIKFRMITDYFLSCTRCGQGFKQNLRPLCEMATTDGLHCACFTHAHTRLC